MTSMPTAVPSVVPMVMRRGADSGATVPLDARNTHGERECERERERNRGAMAAEGARQERGTFARVFFLAHAQERRFLVHGHRHRRLGECGETAPTPHAIPRPKSFVESDFFRGLTASAETWTKGEIRAVTPDLRFRAIL